MQIITVCLYFSVFVRLRISPARIKLAASNFARRFIGVLGRESPILGNLARYGNDKAWTRSGRNSRRSMSVCKQCDAFCATSTVVVYCHSKTSVMAQFLFGAQDKGMTKGDYAFFTFFPIRKLRTDKPWLFYTDDSKDLRRRRQAFYAVKQVSPLFVIRKSKPSKTVE